MVTPWEKNVIWKSIEISFIIENPKKIFYSREIHQRELRSQKNHGNWFLRSKIQKNQLQQREFRENFFQDWKFEKKRVFNFLQDLENKICWWENHATSLCWKFSLKSVSWWKIPWKLFWFKKFHGNEFRWFQKDLIEFVNEKFPEVCSAKIDSMKTAFINGETRTNTFHWRERQMDRFHTNAMQENCFFLEENPSISSIGNPRKFLSTTKMCWNSISSEKNLIHNLPWENAHGKTSVDSFSL